MISVSPHLLKKKSIVPPEVLFLAAIMLKQVSMFTV